VVIDLKAGASAPPLFGLRHFSVELAGVRGVFVARLRRDNLFVCTSGSFFGYPNQAAVKNGHQRAPFPGLPPRTPLGLRSRPPLCLPQPFSGPIYRAPPLAPALVLAVLFWLPVRHF
jgi:hypothetical protein